MEKIEKTIFVVDTEQNIIQEHKETTVVSSKSIKEKYMNIYFTHDLTISKKIAEIPWGHYTMLFLISKYQVRGSCSIKLTKTIMTNLSKDIGKSFRTVQRTITQLVRAGVLRVEKTGALYKFNPNYYWMGTNGNRKNAIEEWDNEEI